MQKIKETGMRLLFALCACISILAVVLICKAASKRKLRKQEKAMEHQKKEDNEP